MACYVSSRSLAWLHCCVLALASLPAAAKAPPTLDIPHYVVDLDRSASTRWTDAIEHFLDEHGTSDFEQTYTEWLGALRTYLPDVFGPPAALKNQLRFLDALEKGHPDAVAEMKTLSASLLRRKAIPEFELPAIAAASAVYVISNIAPRNTTDVHPHRAASACTSTVVVARDGRVLHGRSLDYEPRDPMARTSAEIEFVRSGKPAYTCFHPLVYPAALQWFTCLRPGQFSLSVNARGQGKWTEHNTTYDELLRRVSSGDELLLGEVAAAAMAQPAYADALTVLASQNVVSSNYFILAGAHRGEGSIVTRFGNSSTADVWSIGSGAADGQPSWLRVQTNVDHWVDFHSGAYATYRRQHAIDLLSEAGGSAVDVAVLWKTYLTDFALDASSLQRTAPEDTGVILRPSTIATLVMVPGSEFNGTLDARVWASSPEVHGPRVQAPPISPENVLVYSGACALRLVVLNAMPFHTRHRSRAPLAAGVSSLSQSAMLASRKPRIVRHVFLVLSVWLLLRLVASDSISPSIELWPRSRSEPDGTNIFSVGSAGMDSLKHIDMLKNIEAAAEKAKHRAHKAAKEIGLEAMIRELEMNIFIMKMLAGTLAVFMPFASVLLLLGYRKLCVLERELVKLSSDATGTHNTS